jgi:thiol-disulfide isomerase/thioredoxin
MVDWAEIFKIALDYSAFLDKYASPTHRSRWDAMHARITLAEGQKHLLGSFKRTMPVLVLNGAWCGDCINQCPIFDHFATASPAINLRFLDRDERPEIRDVLAINGGQRVPVVVFLSEDFLEVGRYGDRTLSIYRRLAAQQLGPSCPTGLVPPDNESLAAVVADWLAEFERVQLLLRLSSRLRQIHGD